MKMMKLNLHKFFLVILLLGLCSIYVHGWLFGPESPPPVIVNESRMEFNISNSSENYAVQSGDVLKFIAGEGIIIQQSDNILTFILTGNISLSSILDIWVNVTGDTMTGDLNMSNNKI